MTATGAYETVKSYTSKMDYGRSIFVFGGNEERKNDALNVVDFSIYSSFENIESYQSDIRGLLTTSPK